MKKRLSILLCLLIAVFAVAFTLTWLFVEEPPQRHVNDEDFIMLENTVSRDQRFRLLIYQYDLGALGESRVFWAVTPFNYHALNLADYELPDGYQADGWCDKNELLVEKWEPYYYKRRPGELRTGDFFNGVNVRLVESGYAKEHCRK